MLSMLLCLSCVSVGMTAVFAEDAEYTPVVSLTPEMYSPKTVYVDDDFNNRDISEDADGNANTDLSKIAEGKTEYEHQVIITNSEGAKLNTLYNVTSNSSGEIYVAPSTTWANLVIKSKNDIKADRIAMSFKFKIASTKSFYVLASNSAGSSGADQKLFMFQIGSTGKWTIKYLPTGTTSMANISTNISSQGADTWQHVYFELKRTLGEDGNYSVTIDKLYSTDSEGNCMNIDTSSLSPIDVTWWGNNCTEADWKNVAFVIGRNNDKSFCLDDVMLYVPDDLRMNSASYDSTAGTVKAKFTRGLKDTTLSGITLKQGESVVNATAALDTTDTSNRTVLLTPAAPLDVENKSYTVTASGVQDLEGNEVPTKSVIIGKPALVAENAKYYVNDVEVTTTKMEVTAGQTVAAKADVINPTDSNAEIMPIVAYYEGGVLKCVNDVSTVTVNAGASAQISASFTMPDTDGTNGEFKFFAFKDGKLSPIMGVVQKKRLELKQANLFLVGDSICVHYGNENSKPQTGWGDPFTELMAEELNVVNCSHGGYAVKTFMDYTNYSGNYAKHTWNSETVMVKNSEGEVVQAAATPILPSINAGDYVIVSLGINDSSSTSSGYTNETDYKNYLKQMAADTQAKEAEMIFITPTISVSGKLSDEDKFNYALSNNYGERGQWMKEAAAECGVVCLDLGTEMYNHYKEISNDGTENFDAIRTYHLYKKILLKSVEEGGFGLTQEQLDNHANTKLNKDHTGDGNDGGHLSTKGADMVAGLIVKLLRSSDSSLKYYIK